MTTLQRRAAKAVQIILVAAVVWYALYQAHGDWDKVTRAASQLRPNWGLIFLSATIVFAAYLLLIQAWRRLMRDWGTDIPNLASMRIWFVSVLGRYIPGRIWSAASVALMARQAGHSPLIAMGAALLLTIINTIVGACVLMIASGNTELLRAALKLPEGSAYSLITPVLIAVALAVLLLLPVYVAPLARLAARIAKRDFQPPQLSALAVLRSAGACTGAWILYGIAFWVFCFGVFGSETGKPVAYIAAYTGSYLAGYLFIPSPGGLGVREIAMTTLLPLMTQLSAEQALIAAWSSRVWLTVLEILPGVILTLSGSGSLRPGRTNDITAVGTATDASV